MSETSEKARSAAKAKAEKLVRADPKARVDASGYTPDGAMDGDVAMGMRPISRRAYKSGGKVHGENVPVHAGRMPRKSGPITAESLINRDVKTANEDRGGLTHVGGMKSGGKAEHGADCKCAKCGGGRVGRAPGGQVSPQAKTLAQSAMRMAQKKGTDPYNSQPAQASAYKSLWNMKGGTPTKASGGAINDGTRPVSGRLARKAGGRAKKGTNVNIIITQPGQGGPPAMGPPPGPPMPPPGAPPAMGLHQGTPPPTIPAAAMPVPAPPGVMGRKSGGRVDTKFAKPGRYPIKDGAGGGHGRLEKAKAYGL